MYNSGIFTESGRRTGKLLWKTGANPAVSGRFPAGLWKDTEKTHRSKAGKFWVYSAIYRLCFKDEIGCFTQQNPLFHNFALTTASASAAFFKLYYIILYYICYYKGVPEEGAPAAGRIRGRTYRLPPEEKLCPQRKAGYEDEIFAGNEVNPAFHKVICSQSVRINLKTPRTNFTFDQTKSRKRKTAAVPGVEAPGSSLNYFLSNR